MLSLVGTLVRKHTNVARCIISPKQQCAQSTAKPWYPTPSVQLPHDRAVCHAWPFQRHDIDLGSLSRSGVPSEPTGPPLGKIMNGRTHEVIPNEQVYTFWVIPIREHRPLQISLQAFDCNEGILTLYRRNAF
jgi:hypothetical protein